MHQKSQCRIFCLIVPNPFKEVLHIFRVQAPNMMHTKMAFAWTIISPDREVSINHLLSRGKWRATDTLVLSSIDFRHDPANEKKNRQSARQPKVHHEVFSSHLANYGILLQSGVRWQVWVQNDPTCTNIGFSISALSRGDRIWIKGTTKFSCSHLAVDISRAKPLSRLKPSPNFSQHRE